MSQENVEIVASCRRSVRRRRLGGVASLLRSRVDWRAMEGAPDDVGRMNGTPAMRRYVQDWADDFDDFTVVLEELLDIGDDRVVAVFQLVAGRARQSGDRDTASLRGGLHPP